MKISSKVEICNLALLRVSLDSISSFEDDNTPQGKTCRLIYEQSKSHLLSQYSWTFAIASKVLNRLAVAEAIQEYRYRYALPQGFLRLVGVYGSFDKKVIAIGNIKKPYVLEGQCVLTDLETCKIKYVYDIDTVSEFSPLFIDCFVLDLAIRLTKNFNNSSAYLQQLQSELAMMIAKAKISDCQQTMLDGITSYPILFSTWEF